jgi:hypothetical protein
MSDLPVDPEIGQYPYTRPPPIEQQRFHEDPKPWDAALFTQIMQGRGAPPPRPGYEHQQRAVPRPDDTPSDVAVSGGMTVAELLAMPGEAAQQAIDALREQAAALAEQRKILAEELRPDEPAPPPEPPPPTPPPHTPPPAPPE